MKKSIILFVTLAIVLGFAGLSLAQQRAKPTDKTFLGTVDKVTPADPTKNVKPQIVVVNKANNKLTFVITDTCTFYDAKGGTITFDKIVTGVEVRVTYTTTAQDVNEAHSIKLLK